MRSKLKWLLGGALALFATAAVLAQTIVTQNLVGSEVILLQTGGVGGQAAATQVLNLRNGTGMLVVPSVSGNPTTSLTTANSTVYWVGTAPTTWTVNLPASPFDGEIVSVGTDTTLTSMVTVVAATGTSLNSTYASQTLSAKTSVEFQYSAGTTKWYELR
jgi:hypothetical protein